MGLSLAEPGVQFIDAEGNGRADLLVSRPNLKGYFPLDFEGHWDAQGFVPYQQAPSVSFADPEVKLVDLTGNGLTDVLRTGTSFECYFNDRDPDKAWDNSDADTVLEQSPRRISRKRIEDFPDVRFSDPRIRTADMTGDGLQDIVLIHSGRIDYWPNLGYGRFGARVTMKKAPRFEWGYRPEHVLFGDVDGDGLADVLYVDDGSVTVWMNQSGNGFSDPIQIQGTPRMTDQDAVRLIDLKGTGSPGILWSRDATQPGRAHMYFLDLTGGQKPYMLTEMDNHMGAVTRVAYRPSTDTYLEDDRDPDTRWKTPLPFPVQTVWRVEVIDRDLPGQAHHRIRVPPRLLGRRRARVSRLRPGGAARLGDLRRLHRRRAAPRRLGPVNVHRGVLPAHGDPPLVYARRRVGRIGRLEGARLQR